MEGAVLVVRRVAAAHERRQLGRLGAVDDEVAAVSAFVFIFVIRSPSGHVRLARPPALGPVRV